MKVRDEVITALRNGTDKSDWDDDCASLFFDNDIELDFGGIAFGTYSSNDENVSTSKPVFVRDVGEKIFITFEDVFCAQTETPEEKQAFDSMANDSELPNSSEWEYGDRAEWTGVEFIYVAQHPTRPDRSVCIHLDHGSAYSILTCDLKKPETPQQREERERLEAAYDLYVESNNALGLGVDFADFEIDSAGYLAIVDKTGYRKAK